MRIIPGSEADKKGLSVSIGRSRKPMPGSAEVKLLAGPVRAIVEESEEWLDILKDPAKYTRGRIS